MPASIQNNFSHNLPTIAKTALVSSTALLLIIGIWQLSSPFICKSPAAGWAFIGVAGLEVGLALLWVIKSKIGAKSKIQFIPPEIRAYIFSFMDLQTLTSLERVCKQFRAQIKSDEFRKMFWESPRGIRFLREKKSLIGDLNFKNQIEKKLLDDRMVGEADVQSNLIVYADELLFVSDPNGIGIRQHRGEYKWNYHNLRDLKNNVLGLCYGDEKLFWALGGDVEVWKIDTKKGVGKQIHFFKAHTSTRHLFYEEGFLLTAGYDQGLNGEFKTWKQNDKDEWICVNTLSFDRSINLWNRRHLLYSDKTLFSISDNGNEIKIWKFLGVDKEWDRIPSIQVDGITDVKYEKGFLFMSSEREILIMQFDEQQKKFVPFQTLEVTGNISSIIDIFAKNKLLFARAKEGLLIGDYSRKDKQWKWIHEIERNGYITRHFASNVPLFYGDGRLLTGVETDTGGRDIRVWA